MIDKSYKELMPNIKTFIFDIDGVLTNGIVKVLTNGELIRSMNIKDGYALRVAVDKGYKVFIISGGNNKGILERLKSLGITEVHLGISNKIEVFEQLCIKYSLNTENILYMGDDIPDYSVMQKVGLPCCPNDATVEIKNISYYISHKSGGEGCVRDVIEQVMRVQGKWLKI